VSDKVKIKLITLDGEIISRWSFKGKNLWDVIALGGMEPGGSCGGRGTCGKCKVKVEGEISPLSESEKQLLLPEEIKKGQRLACHCSVNGPATVYLDFADYNIKTKSKIYRHPELTKNTNIEYRKIFIPGIERYNPVPILERLKKALPDYSLELSVVNLNGLSILDRVGRPSLELYALVFDHRVVKFVGRHKERVLGVALDLGTTSLFGALIDLQTGETVALSSKNNMQRVYGDDVISRISYCQENKDGLEKLHTILINNINSMMEDMLTDAGVSRQNVFQFSIVGNPVMLHLLLGLSPRGFGSVPFVGVFSDELVYKASYLGLYANQAAEVIILPQIGGFVGADTVACLLTILPRPNDNYLLIDIGTNGEIVLHSHGKMWAASAAAGPAFEGGKITCGVRAGIGAIDRVFINHTNELNYNVIGEGPVRGLCGSAIIDLTACLVLQGLVDGGGRITPRANEAFKIREGANGQEIVIIGKDNKDLGIVFKQDDIRQVQLAKSAIRTAVDMLLQEAKIEYEDIDTLYLAGAFGNYMNSDNAIAIGLIPPLPKEKIINIGNAAGQGAVYALLSADKRKQAGELAQNINYIELANLEEFNDKFIANLNF